MTVGELRRLLAEHPDYYQVTIARRPVVEVSEAMIRDDQRTAVVVELS